MQRSTVIFAATTAVVGIISVQLWQELDDERFKSRNLQLCSVQLRVMQKRLKATGPQQTGGSQDLAAGLSLTGQKFPSTASISLRDGVSLDNNTRELMKDPDYREGWELSARALVAQSYPDLAREMYLTPEQADQLLDLLTKRQMASTAVGPLAGVDDAAAMETQAAREAGARDQDDKIAALLGASKQQQWKEYQQTLGARRQVAQLQTILEPTSQVLDDRQQMQLMTTLATEETRVVAEARQSRSARSMVFGDQVAMMEEVLQREEERTRRILSGASSYLSAQQLGILRKIQNGKLSMQRAMIHSQQQAQSAP